MNKHIKKLTHVTVKSRHFDQAVAFYGKILGLEEKFTLFYDEGLVKRMGQTGFVKPGDPWITYFKISDREFIEVFNQTYAGEWQAGDYSYAYVTLKISSAAEAASMLAGRGITLYDEGPDGKEIAAEEAGDCFFVKDPDGNFIRLCSA